MEYAMGKWLERIETKLNTLLLVNGVDPETLQALQSKPQQEEPEETVTEEPEEDQEEIDTEEPEAQSMDELEKKADAIKKAMDKRKGGETQ